MSVIWGIPYLFIAIAVDEITPATLVLGRTAIASAILLPIAALRTDLRPILARWRWVVAFAAVEIAIPWVALGSAEQHISSSLAGLLIAGVPLVGASIALTTGGADRFGRVGIAGLLIGIVGVAAIVGADFAATDTTALLQIGVVVVGYAVGPAILSRRLQGLPTVGVMAVSIVCTAAAFMLFGALIDEVGPVRATVITYVNPAVAAVLGVVVLRETLTVAMGIGFVLVITGSMLATRPAQSRRAAAEPVAA